MEKSILGAMATFGKEVKKYFLKNCQMNLPKMSETQGRIMRYIFEHRDEEISNKVLEVNLNLSKATVSDTLDRMEENNLIERIPSEADARKKLIKMKEPKNHKKFDTAIKDFENLLCDGIEKEDLEVFVKVLMKMEQNLGKEK